MVKALTLEQTAKNRHWNKGYADGYNKRIKIVSSLTYSTAYDIGAADRAEDEEAIASGEFDLLTEEERREIYGDEHDKP
jgi:hypothetical protein